MNPRLHSRSPFGSGLSPGKSRNRKLGLAHWDGQLARIGVEKSASHHLSQTEIASDNPSYQHLSHRAQQLVLHVRANELHSQPVASGTRCYDLSCSPGERSLGIRNLFSKGGQDEVVDAKILVASLDPKFLELTKVDSN
jgi:hypothetical protein